MKEDVLPLGIEGVSLRRPTQCGGAIAAIAGHAAGEQISHKGAVLLGVTRESLFLLERRAIIQTVQTGEGRVRIFVEREHLFERGLFPGKIPRRIASMGEIEPGLRLLRMRRGNSFRHCSGLLDLAIRPICSRK
jgi:hypothetical protein